MRMIPSTIAALTTLASLGAGGEAQTPADSAEAGFCLSGERLPRCRGFLLTELGASYRLGWSGPGYALAIADEMSDVQINFELGGMVNVSRRSAVGVAMYVRDLDADRGRSGLRARYRHWLDDRVSLESGAGFIMEAADVGATDALRGARVLGFSGQVRANLLDLVGLGLEYESIDLGPRGIRRDWFVTGRFGSEVGMAGLAPIAALLLIGMIAMSAG